MQPGDIRKIRTPGSVSVSPDGARVRSRHFIDGSAYCSALFAAPTDGSAPPERLTEGLDDSASRGPPTARRSRSCGSTRAVSASSS